MVQVAEEIYNSVTAGLRRNNDISDIMKFLKGNDAEDASIVQQGNTHNRTVLLHFGTFKDRLSWGVV